MRFTRRVIPVLLALLMLISTAAAEFDALAILRYRSSYAYALTQERNAGTCRTLCGDVELTVVIVSADGAPWTVTGLNEIRRSVSQAIYTLEREASGYDVALEITPVYYNVTAPSDADADKWFESTIAAIPGLADTESWNDRPILFCLNTEGRCYAVNGGSTPEYVVFYAAYEPSTVRHELLHLYGAADFYFHDDITQAAKTHLGRSIMLYSYDNAAVTDPLTAYLVGWTEEPEGKAADFMSEVSPLTNDEVVTAQRLDQQSGTGTFELDAGTFYGTLEMGCANGLGLQQYSSGASYVGDWSWNSFDGKGTLTWADGAYYTGDFDDDKRTGRGTLVNTDGTTYTGDFIDGRQTGKGTITWADGSTYTGDFSDGKRTGRGTMTWADGRTYTGEFSQDAINGMGMMSFTNGDTYIGQFKDGAMHGVGTMYYSDGTVKNGKWENGTFIGE